MPHDIVCRVFFIEIILTTVHALNSILSFMLGEYIYCLVLCIFWDIFMDHHISYRSEIGLLFDGHISIWPFWNFAFIFFLEKINL